MPRPDIDGQYRESIFDNYERVARDDYTEHLHALAERERECEPDWKPDKRASRKEAWGEGLPQLFRRLVLDRDQGCCVHANSADCDEGWQAHHVVKAQELRRSRPDALWDARSGMGVCGKAHRQHHSRVAPIPYEAIPLIVVEYLSGLGFGPYLERHYAAIGAPLRDGQA